MTVVLVFDCETSGLLPKQKGDVFPLIIQLSFVLYDVGKKDIVEIYDQYVKLPSDVVLSPIITEITGIRRQTLDKNGLDILKVLKAFYEAVLKADVIVAHNMEFDFTVLLSTASKVFPPLECELQLLNKPFRTEDGTDQLCKSLVCTMKKGMDLCKIPRVNSRGVYYKYPTLAELHTHLFGYVPKNLHDARIDVLCCLRCFLKMTNVYDVPEDEFLDWIECGPKMCFWF
jgi:DNA polymerase III epsilon subunit-like protein